MFRIANQNIPRLESNEKVIGAGQYTDDFSIRDMVFGAVLRSPHPHARARSINPSAALLMPGVLDVLLPNQVQDIRYNASGNPPSPMLLEDELILTDNPLFEGDSVVAVAATSPLLCKQALERISVDWEVLPALLSVDAALAPGAPLLHPDIGGSNDFMVLKYDKGDIAVGMAACDIVIEDEFITPPVHPLPLEPTGCICEWTREGITIHSTSQTMFQERRLLARMFNLSESRVRIVKPLMGGGFGARQQLHYQPIGCLLSKRIGRPVKMILSREEEMTATTVRHSARMRVRLGADKEGRILAMDTEVWHNTGAYCTHGPIILAAQGKKTPYDIQHYRYRGHCVYTNSVTAGAMRGYGNPQLTFARELLVDRLARRLKIDPVQLRLRNHLRTGDLVPGSTTEVTSCKIDDCAAEALRIQSDVDRHRSSSGQWGVAFCMHTSGPSNKSGLSSASIYVNQDGSIQLNLGTADIGQGSETALAQVAAEVLGIPLSAVNVHSADTRSTPYDTGTFASSQMFVGGNAVLLAAHSAIEDLSRAFADAKGVAREQVSFKGGMFSFSGENCTFAEAANESLFGAKGRVVFGEGSYKAVEAPPVFAVCLARVERDSLTGVITVTDLIETVDVGTVINHNIVQGQIEGGVVQGLGYCWMEQIETDPRTGKNMTADALLYKIPTSRDIPRIHVASVPSYDPYGPLGAKSVGELTLVPVAAALAVAVERVSGETVNRLPLSTRFLMEAKEEQEEVIW